MKRVQVSIDLQTYDLRVTRSRIRAYISLSWLVYASISAWFSGRRVQVRDPERGQILTSSNVTIVLIVQCRFEETLSVGHPDLEPRAPPRASRGRFENSRFSSLGEMYNRCWRRVYYCRWSARNSSPPPPSSFSLHLFQLPLSSIPHLLWFLDRLMIYIYIQRLFRAGLLYFVFFFFFLFFILFSANYLFPR